MGVSDKMARRYAQSLEQKGYLRRLVRVGRTNRFNLTPLFDALRAAVMARRASSKERAHDETKSSGGGEQAGGDCRRGDTSDIRLGLL